jgi:hypothetical protein
MRTAAIASVIERDLLRDDVKPQTHITDASLAAALTVPNRERRSAASVAGIGMTLARLAIGRTGFGQPAALSESLRAPLVLRSAQSIQCQYHLRFAVQAVRRISIARGCVVVLPNVNAGIVNGKTTLR